MKKLFLLSIFSAFTITFFSGCAATVPEEAIALSEMLGNDLVNVQASYSTLIRSQYQKMRDEAEIFIRDKYTPYILKSVITKRNVLQNITDKINAEDFNDALDYMTAFSRSALKQIDKFRAEMLEPINAQEQQLLADVDAAFQNMRNANATITAHLASIRKVQKEQDYLLEKAQLKDLRDQVLDRSVNLSNEISGVLNKMDVNDQSNPLEVIQKIKGLVSDQNK